jgi:lipopolysaccharide export system protein LptA
LTAGAPWRQLIVALMLSAVLPAGAENTPTPGSASQADLLSRLSLSSKGGPVNISSKELEFDYRTRALSYRGSVVVSQNDLKLSSDALRVVLNEQERDVIREVIAEGHVRIEQGQRVATGGRAVFDQSKRTVVLSENAVLREGSNEVAGERVVVYVDEQRMVVEGGNQRVRAVLYPQDIEKGAKESARDDHEQ